MNRYTMLIHLPFRYFVLFSLMLISFATSAELYNPFRANGGNLDFFGNYCVNEKEEARLWIGINQYSTSFLKETPSIPPEQAKYIKEESEASVERLVQILSNPISIMSDTRQSVENIKSLSQQFIDNQRILTLAKKMEFIGRVMDNLRVDTFSDSGAKNAAMALSAKSYFVSENTLKENTIVFRIFNRMLIRQLICYGEIQK